MLVDLNLLDVDALGQLELALRQRNALVHFEIHAVEAQRHAHKKQAHAQRHNEQKLRRRRGWCKQHQGAQPHRSDKQMHQPEHNDGVRAVLLTQVVGALQQQRRDVRDEHDAG